MNKKAKLLTCLSLAGAIGGCAHLPDATVKYYLPKSKVSFKVVRTVSCDADSHVLVASAVTPTVTHMADRSDATTKSIDLAKLKGAFADSDVKVDFYDDGRLKGLNGSSTGQGESILKTVISVVGAVLAFDQGKPKAYPAECAAIKKLGGDKPLALTYESEVNLSSTAEQKIKPEAITSVILDVNKLEHAVGYVCATVMKPEKPAPRIGYDKKAKDILLSVREPGLAEIKLTAGGENSCQSNPIWDDYVVVAQAGTPYDLPIPPPTTFGKRTLAVTFAESGALQSAQFVSNTGTGQALNVISAGQTATKSETTAEKANAIKAEADLIAQQQRLAQCLADPKNCK